jgi:hypothetical protein
LEWEWWSEQVVREPKFPKGRRVVRYRARGRMERGQETRASMVENQKSRRMGWWILTSRPEEIQDHRIVITLGAKPADKGNAGAASEGLVRLALILELGMFSLDGLEFDGDKRSAPDLLPEAVFTTHTEVHTRWRRGWV